MSLLTTKGVYGLMAILEISKGDRSNPISLKDISLAINVSKNYLEQLLNSLRKDGIVGSIKGIKGGYYLSKPIDEITLYELFSSLENEINLINIELENTLYNLFFNPIRKSVMFCIISLWNMTISVSIKPFGKIL